MLAEAAGVEVVKAGDGYIGCVSEAEWLDGGYTKWKLRDAELKHSQSPVLGSPYRCCF